MMLTTHRLTVLSLRKKLELYLLYPQTPPWHEEGPLYLYHLLPKMFPFMWVTQQSLWKLVTFVQAEITVFVMNKTKTMND
jgi:hypothetical protein